MAKPPSAESRIGTSIAERYRLDAVLGVGGFGAVYRAHDSVEERDVAVKLLHDGAGELARKRLAREAKVLARLDHPNCVRLTDFGTHADTAYLVMELIAGRPLSKALGQPWPIRRALDVALELLAGLAHAHALGLVHRDLKPGNVLLVDDAPAGERVKIIDFGIVAIAAGEQLGSFAEQLTATGRIIGTPRYMSPEQLLGAKIDARTDLYAFGLLLFEMLAGHPVFEASDARQLAWMHAVAPPPLLPDHIGDALAELVMQLLGKKPQQRPADADRVRARLLALLPALDEPSQPPLTSTLARVDPIEPVEAIEHEHPDPTTALPAPRDATSETAELETGSLRDPTPLAATKPRAAKLIEAERHIGRYLLLRELGRGAMGVVHLGWDEALDRQAAIKLLRPGPAHQHANQRMLREARALARVEHANVVGIYEFGAHQQQLFVAMQYVRGRTLRAWLDERERTWTETLARLLEAGRGLAAVHAAGLVHRDFKPDNVLIGTDERARVADFGLVRAASPAFDMIDRLVPGLSPADRDAAVDPLAAKLTRSGAIIGTPAYMALEQLAGDRVDARSDQFAFCAVAFEALHGVRPFTGRTLEELAAKLTAGRLEPRQVDSLVPPGIDDVLARGLQVMPASRWPSMDALLDALEHAAGTPRRTSAKRPLIAAGIGVALLAGSVWAFAGREHAEPDDADPSLHTAAPDPALERRVHELEQRLDHVRIELARSNPAHPESLAAVLELATRSPEQPLSLEQRAAIHAVAGVVYEHHALDELGQINHLLAWSPTAPLLALAKPDGGIALWDANAHALARSLAHDHALVELGFSRDGELLLAIDDQARALLWHVSTGTALGTIDEPGLRIASFVGDTRELAIVSDEGVSLWALVRGKELERARSLVDQADMFALASTDAHVLMLSAGGTATTWTRADDRLDEVALDGFTELTLAYETLAISPDARHIARASAHALEFWDPRTGKRVTMQTPADIGLPALGPYAFSPDSQTLAVAVRGRAPLLANPNTGEIRSSELAPPLVTHALGFDSSGTLHVLGDDGRVSFASAHARGQIPTLTNARTLAIDPQGQRLALVDADGRASVWASHSVAEHDIEAFPIPSDSLVLRQDETERFAQVVVSTPAGDEVLRFTPNQPITTSAISPDADMIATAWGSWPAQVEVRSRAGQLVRTLEVDGQLRALAFSPDARQLACAGFGPQVEIWSLETGERMVTLRTDEHVIQALAFSPDKSSLAVGGHDVHVWEIAAGRELAAMSRLRRPIHKLAFAPDGGRLAVVLDDDSQIFHLLDEQALLEGLQRVGSASANTRG